MHPTQSSWNVVNVYGQAWREKMGKLEEGLFFFFGKWKSIIVFSFCAFRNIFSLSLSLLPGSKNKKKMGSGVKICSTEKGRKKKNLPNQQRTLSKLPPELRCGNFVDKHRLSMQIGAKHAKNGCATCTYSDGASILRATVGGWVRVTVACLTKKKVGNTSQLFFNRLFCCPKMT